tara:strand:- start:1544 stop:1768 length:225 start_codon:yes stop_codon:yes gene_type:complete
MTGFYAITQATLINTHGIPLPSRTGNQNDHQTGEERDAVLLNNRSTTIKLRVNINEARHSGIQACSNPYNTLFH